VIPVESGLPEYLGASDIVAWSGRARHIGAYPPVAPRRTTVENRNANTEIEVRTPANAKPSGAATLR
jgi:hypothetical protein